MIKVCNLISDFTIRSGYKNYFNGLLDSSLSLSISELADKCEQWLVCVTPTALFAEQLIEEVKFFLKKDYKYPIAIFPDWETLPYDRFSPHEGIISSRLKTINLLKNYKQGILILPINTIMQRIAPISFLSNFACSYKVGNNLNLIAESKFLTTAGYQRINQVSKHGDFAVRGAILDLFPMGGDYPIRIDLLDDKIDSIRIFDVESQRSTKKINSLELLPAKEFPTSEEAIKLFKINWQKKFSRVSPKHLIYSQVSKGLWPLGIEYYLPLFFNETSSLFDYLPADSWFVQINDIYQAAINFFHQVKTRYEQYSSDIERPILLPEDIFLAVNETFEKFNCFPQFCLNQKLSTTKNIIELPDLSLEMQAGSLQKLQRFLHKYSNYRVLFVTDSEGRIDILCDLLRDLNLIVCDDWFDFINSRCAYYLSVAPISKGFIFPKMELIIITENDLQDKVFQSNKKNNIKYDTSKIVSNLDELNIGDLVVHLQHGIGRYQGLVHLTVDNQISEFVLLEFSGADKLYIPVSFLHLISKYSAVNSASVQLNKLGSDKWQKNKRKATEQIADVAAELLDIYSKRALKKGIAFTHDGSEYKKFSGEFPFEETPDQKLAIKAVIEDLKKPNPMDRVICGDVGFGKTEVAMRAAFWVIEAQYQVAILAPTTLLAQQHYETFCDRLANFPIKVDFLSRFRNIKEQKEIMDKLARGKIDLIIGTHKLFSKTIKFSKLGLLIIDEEHRFGVKQKEKFKEMRSEIDILTLTATPIPRTLSMAMSGVRDLSIIATPPAKRLSVKTFVRKFNFITILEAIERELHRGGQVYYVHNEINTIEILADKLRKSLPNARISVAHGSMRERDLEIVMRDFCHRKYDILVCTTIIETGIDVANANTIIIERADKFGLAQLHQLRGRIGRSHHQAYALLLTLDERVITKDALKRLEAIQLSKSLGAGFTLATHDLEIRGAGEILGEEQSGHIQSVGFTLYNELLDKAVKILKSGKNLEENDLFCNDELEIDLKLPAFIPEDYIPNVNIRLFLYRKIANSKNKEELAELKLELIDRFGSLPKLVNNLLSIAKIKLQALVLGVKKLKIIGKNLGIYFKNNPNIDYEKIMSCIQNQPDKYKFLSSNSILILDVKELDKILIINDFFKKII